MSKIKNVGRPSTRCFSWNGWKTGVDWPLQPRETGRDQRSIFVSTVVFQVNYYAVMHRYKGPVFIKPSPMSLEELLKAVRYLIYQNDAVEIGFYLEKMRFVILLSPKFADKKPMEK